MEKNLRNFPREVLTDPWPMLMPSPADKRYQPAAETPEHFAQRTFLKESNSQVPNFFLVLFKGAILGSMTFSLIFGIVLHGAWWFPNWHWAFALGGVGLLLFLFGFQRTLLFLTAALFLTLVPLLVSQREILVLGGGFLGGGMILRGVLEIAPRKPTT